jgi:hypothetical protein
MDRQNERPSVVIGKKRGRKPTPVGILDREVARNLADFIQELALEFDLSPETARAKSVGAKRFSPHKLTGSDGLAKIGGVKLSGECRIDRYISYGVGDTMIALCAWLPLGAEPDKLMFHLFAPENELDTPKTWRDLRPKTKPPKHYLTAQEFRDQHSAMAKMKILIARFADSR